MTRPHGWLRALRFWRANPAADVDAELAFHIEQRVTDLVARGLTREAASAQADAEFGNRTAVRDTLVEIDERMALKRRRAAWWEAGTQDIAYALRGLRRSPGFSVVVIVTLALGLGANTALFSVLERLFWRPPAGVQAPHEVRRVHNHYVNTRKNAREVRSVFNYPEMRDVMNAKPGSLALAGFHEGKMRLGRDAGASLGASAEIIGDYFGVLGVQPAAGRFFTADEARAETFETVAVISHRLWLTSFGGASSAIGHPLDLGMHRYTIIGVAPEAFHGLGLNATDVWIPMSTAGSWTNRDPKWYEGLNTLSIRLITRVRSAQDSAAMGVAATRAMRERNFMRDSLQTAQLAPVIESVWPDGGSAELTMAQRLAGVSVILLLIACANVANLLLARGLRRRREIAVRLALGVSQSRLIRMLITESVALSLIAGAAAVIVGAFGAAALKRALLPNVVWGDSLWDWRIALFSVALALVTGVAAAIVPAIRASRSALVSALKASARDGGGQRSRLRSGLIIAQTALSVVLVATAGLFVLSLRRVERIDIGYVPKQILFAQAVYPEVRPSAADINTRLVTVAERIGALPGVEVVARAESPTFAGIGFMDAFMANRDSLPKMSAQGPFVSYVSNEFFDAAGMRVLRGRGFSDDDRVNTRPVMIVNESMARGVWHTDDVVGQCLILDELTEPCREVIGVVSDAHALGIVEEPSAQFYLPFSQWPKHSPYTLVIRAAPGKMQSVIPAVRATMTDAFAGWAPPRLRTMQEILAPQLQPRQLAASAYGAAGLLALIIAAVGIYGSVAYAVSQRMHEMGVRSALGAGTANIMTLVIGEGVKVVMIGVALGVALQLVAGRAVSSLLYETSTRDPTLLAFASSGFVIVAITACIMPAWRASRASPLEVLRADS